MPSSPVPSTSPAPTPTPVALATFFKLTLPLPKPRAPLGTATIPCASEPELGLELQRRKDAPGCDAEELPLAAEDCRWWYWSDAVRVLRALIVEDGIPKTSLAAGERTKLGAFGDEGGDGSAGEGCVERTAWYAFPGGGIRPELVGGGASAPPGVEEDDTDRVVTIGREIFDKENFPCLCLTNSSDPPRRPCLLPKLENGRLRDTYGGCGNGVGGSRDCGCDVSA